MKVPFINLSKFRIGSQLPSQHFPFYRKGKFAALHTYIVPLVEDFFVRIGCEKERERLTVFPAHE
jgi:hypothetical protein